MPTDLNGKPFQLTFVRPAQMMLFANVVCHPPLGQATVVYEGGAEKKVKFHVMIESSVSFPQQPWEAVLWHNCNSTDVWTGLNLEESDTSDSHLAISSSDRPKVYRRFFFGTLSLSSNAGGPKGCFEFTFKYRTELSGPWRWVNDNSNLGNGSIILQKPALPTELSSLFNEFGSSFTVQNVPSEANGTKLFQLTHAVKGAGKESCYQTDVLGVPKDFTRWTSIGRLWTPWLAPQHGKERFQLHLDGVEASFLRKDGIHLVLLAISAVKNVATVIKSSDKGEVLIESRNDETESASGIVLAAVGHSHAATLGACMYQARRLVGSVMDSIAPQLERNHDPMQVRRLQEMIEADKKVRADWYEEWQDSFTYCTWNGLGQNLTEEKILNALDDLAKHDIQIGNLIIDDNWQDLDNEGKNQMDRGWKGFDANKEGFPDGLKETVNRIRQKQPQIHTIAVWHALLGYWGGISPEGELAKKYKIKKVARADIKTPGGWTHPGGSMHIIDEPDIQRMYNDFYDFLESVGINAVKTDAQFILDLMASPEDRRKYTKAYQDAWSISGLSHFGHRQISCMSLFPQNIFHNLMQMNKPMIMVRNSDDFFPEIPESHPWHIFTNAHTSRFTAFLNALPDWDMFQTSHPYSSFHAAARCVSGGPIYFTDEPGKHDIDLIKQMTAKTIQGKNVILRPDVIGRVIESQDYVGYDEGRALKIGAYWNRSKSSASFLGVFNASRSALTDFVMIEDFPSFSDQTETVILRAHTTGEVSLPSQDAPAASLYLPTKGWEILTAWLLQPLAGNSDVKVACFGLLGKMTGGAAVLSFNQRYLSNKRVEMDVGLKALGTLGIYISDLDGKTVEENFMVTIENRPIPVETVKLGLYNVLEVDLETAWKKMGLKAGWLNELTVKIIMQG